MMKKISLLALSLLLSNSGYASLEHNKVLDEALDVVLDEAAQEELRNLVVNAVVSGKLTQAQAEQILVGTKTYGKSSDKDLSNRYFVAGLFAGLAVGVGGYLLYNNFYCTSKAEAGNSEAVNNQEDVSSYNHLDHQQAEEETHHQGISSQDELLQSRMQEGNGLDCRNLTGDLPEAESNEEDRSFSNSLHDEQPQGYSQFERGSSTEIEDKLPQVSMPVYVSSDSSSESASDIDVDEYQLRQRLPMGSEEILNNMPAQNFEEELPSLQQQGRISPTPSQVSVASTNVSTASRRSNRVSVAPIHYGVYATPQQLSSALRNDKPAKKVNTRRK